MDKKNSPNRTDRLWAEVEARTKSLRGGKRLTEKLRRKFSEKDFNGAIATRINDGPLFEHAVQVLSNDVESMAKGEAAKLAEAKLDAAIMSFWATCAEDGGFDPDANLSFDPATATIRVGRGSPSYGARSAAKTLEGLTTMVSEALESPLTAGTMAEDIRLPWWLRRLAENLKVEMAGDIRPKFRSLVERWISDPEEGRRWAEFADGKLPGWAVETARVLGARRVASN
ncbi:MAG TPA: hypothetical protein ENI79_01735 [Rhodospirillales bacterium]|nr:hypothetical protein [Rhodospirillales bacterium]